MARTPLLERERELAALDALLDAAATAAERGLALVEGPAGAGKSRLLEAARAAARRRGLRVLSAHAVELERAFPFGVARQLVEPLLAGADAQERARLLAGPAGLAASLLEGDADAAAIAFGDDHRHALAHGLRWLLANAGQPRPCIALVDDAHWADEPSLAFLAALAARLDLPLVLVLALRPGEPDAAEELLDRLRGAPGARLLRPAPLGPRAVSALVARRLPAPDPAFVAACATATDGNPFLLTELIEAAAADAVAPTAAAASQVRSLVPETILRATLLRFRRLPPEAVALARAAAVLGERAPLARAAALVEIDDATAAEAADRLAATHVLAPGEPLRFVHPLVAGAVAADLPAHARARLHARAAELLEAAGEAPAAVAAHLLQAPAGA
ncbi:AAA family ATPase, partial [Conexibacter stalactiti]